MKYSRELISIDEVLAADPKEINAVLKASEYELQEGDRFFIKKDSTRKLYIVENTSFIDGECYIHYAGSQKITFDEVGILFSVGSMIEIMSLHDSFELKSSRSNLIVIFDSNQLYEAKEEENLASFLWRVLKDLSVNNKLS